MRTHLALLRGINVGGRNRVAMADLRDVVESLGHAEVATYIQSGNVVFAACDPRADPAVLAQALEERTAQRLGVQPAVIVLSLQDMQTVVRENPFPEESNPKALHAVFLRDAPGPSRLAGIAQAVQRAREQGSEDEAQVVAKTLYLHTPDGLGRSRLAAELARIDRGLDRGEAGTARNWATVQALLALLQA